MSEEREGGEAREGHAVPGSYLGRTHHPSQQAVRKRKERDRKQIEDREREIERERVSSSRRIYVFTN